MILKSKFSSLEAYTTGDKLYKVKFRNLRNVKLSECCVEVRAWDLEQARERVRKWLRANKLTDYVDKRGVNFL